MLKRSQKNKNRINLQENEQIVYRTGFHWVMLLGPAMVLIIAGVSIPSRGVGALILLIIGVVWAIFSIMSYRNSEFLITDGRLLARFGFPWKRIYDIPLTTIEYIDMHQPALGNILNFGKILIRRTGGFVHSIRMIPNPIEFVKKVQEQIILNRNKTEPF
ncbi:MAG: PH domain-containing protein [Proteobacteria bacterium]|nr:PH domain-containing protein [Pseudomonadota bacterium]